MAKKKNIRSIRFSDAMIEMIESQSGESFTAKFEALVTRCMWELPEKEKQLEQIQQQINRERQKLDRIRKQTNDLEFTMTRLESAANQCNNMIKRQISTLEEMCNTD